MLIFRVDALETVPTRPDEDEDGGLVPDPPRLQLSAEKVWNNLRFKTICLNVGFKRLNFSFRSLWTEPTWWTVETKWSFSLGKLCRVSSVRRWPRPIFVGLIQKLPSSSQMFGVSQPSYVDENLTDLPELENEDSERLRSFVASFTFHQNYFYHFSFPQASLNLRKSHPVPVRIIRDDSKTRTLFTRCL